MNGAHVRNPTAASYSRHSHCWIGQAIWRDAATGKQLAASDQFPKMSAGILVTPGYAGLQYFLTAGGHIFALQVSPNSAS